MDAEFSAQTDANATVECPACGGAVQRGEHICPHCRFPLESDTVTYILQGVAQSDEARSWPKGDAVISGQKPVAFEIEGHVIQLPATEFLTIGRSTSAPDGLQPDVDLALFGALYKGVSRLHLRLRRNEALVYASDLGSSNGTWLNGRRMIPNAERVLRDGDELQLGQLRIRVRYPL